MRINGLVRMANGVRRELAGGVSAERKEKLRETVAKTIADVDQMMRGHGGAGALPGPSRRAYEVLKAIEWEKVEVGEPTGSVGQFSWPGLLRRLEGWLERLADVGNEGELEPIGKSIELQHRRIEGDVQRLGIRPEGMSPATRAARGWVAYFSIGGNLREYHAAVGRARNAFAGLGERWRWKGPVSVQFRPVGVIYRVTPSARRTTVWLPTPMLVFDEAMFKALGEMMVSEQSARRREVNEAMHLEPYERLRMELEVLGGVAEQVRGMTHDLGASFERVNAAHFGGRMQRPRLTWNRVMTGRKFGHYDFLRDVVMLSSTLDQPGVPEFVVDYVMYHELLHKEMGVDVVNGRRYAHTREFYEAERKFKGIAEANAVLDRLARGT